MSGGVGQLLASVLLRSNGQLVYGGSVCEKPSGDASRLLESKGEEMGATCKACTPWDALGHDRSIQVRLSGWEWSVKGLVCLHRQSNLFPDCPQLFPGERRVHVTAIQLKLQRTVAAMWHLEERGCLAQILYVLG